MKKTISSLLALAFSLSIYAQSKAPAENITARGTTPGYTFETIADLDATEVKSQGRTGTCWSFSTSSFIESEILRISGKSVDLSEMYNARMVYPEKAKNYVGRQGKAQFSEGSLNHDVMKVIKEHGLITEEAYQGKIVNKNRYDHSELASVLEGYVNAVTKNESGSLSSIWLKGFEAVLDTYLGEIPESFKFEGKEYTPASFRDALKINPDDYLQFTSFKSYPYNSQVVLNIPDNWANGSYYNLELKEYQNLIEHALKEGYSVAIDADVSEKTFSSKQGMAIVPAMDLNEMDKEEKEILFKVPVTEKIITPEFRQQEFNNFNTTDDHLMHITGLLKDQNGTLYFRVKNSWGTEGQGHNGNVYFSESYLQLKSISVMMHKDAVPSKLKKKLGIK
ncbi:MAG: C1 family peptidase [Bacteroidota bacterium]